MSKKKQGTPQPYDELFKESTLPIPMIKEIIDDCVPKDFVAPVNLATLELCPQEHRSAILDNRRTDVVYRAQTWDDETCYFYTHLEQERSSKHNDLLPWRMHVYRVHLIEEHFKRYPEDKRIPLIYQIVIYNSNIVYHGPQSLEEMVAPQYRELWKKYWQAPINLLDLNNLDEQDAINQERMYNVLWLLLSPKFIQDPLKYMDDLLPKLMERVIEMDFHGFPEEVLNYLVVLTNNKDYNIDQMQQFDHAIRAALPGELEGSYMGLQQLWKEEGIQLGTQQGRALGYRDAVLKLHQKGHSADQISDLLDVPYLDVQKIISS